MTTPIFLILTAFIMTLLLSYISLSVITSKKSTLGYFMDIPDDRKIHKHIVPRIGGIPFALVTLFLSLFIFDLSSEYFWYLMPATGIFLLGVFDDFSAQSWKTKLISQIVLGSITLLAFPKDVIHFELFHINFFLDKPFVFILFMIWFLGILNAVNLVDGMDGLAGGIMAIISLGAIYLGWLTGKEEFLYLYLSLSSCLFAFLFYNGKPAKFFMGDAGSLFLGFHVAAMPLLFFLETPDTQAPLKLTPFILFSTYFILDTLRVFFERIKNKQNPLLPDKNHFHHRLLSESSSYNTTLFVIFFLVATSVTLTLITFDRPSSLYSFIAFHLFMGLFIFFPKIHLSLITIAKTIVKKNRKYLKRKKTSNVSKKTLAMTLLLYFSALVISSSHFLLINNSKTLIPLIIAILATGYFLYSRQIIKGKTFIVTLITVQYILLIDQKGLSDINYYLTYSRFAVTALTLLSIGRYFHNKSLSFLMRFWTIKDILFLVIGMASFCLLLLETPTPALFPSSVILIELFVIYVASRIIF